MKKIIVIALVAGVMMLSSCGESKDDITLEEPQETQIEYNEEEAEIVSEVVEAPDEPLPDPVMINADFDVTPNPEGTFRIETNLPTETELSLTLKGRGYLAQGKAVVQDGIAISEQFSDHGDPLFGDFTLEVMMPIPSVQSEYVQHFIGKRGQYLEGPYLEAALGSVVVSKEFKVSFPVNSAASNEQVNNSSVTSDVATSGTYYRTKTGKRYHLDPNCGGEGSFVATSIADLTPCIKCAK